MQLIQQLCLILVASCLAISPLHAAEEQHDESQAEARGPHGGILLQQNDATVELQIFEQGSHRNTGPGSPGMAAPLLMILTSMSSSPAWAGKWTPSTSPTRGTTGWGMVW